jgi:hypothetical protein
MDWLIVECHMYGHGQRQAVIGNNEHVFFMMYVSSHAALGCEALLESDAFFAPLPSEPAVVMVKNKKRAAPPVVGPPLCPKRIHAALSRRTASAPPQCRLRHSESGRHCHVIPVLVAWWLARSVWRCPPAFEPQLRHFTPELLQFYL